MATQWSRPSGPRTGAVAVKVAETLTVTAKALRQCRKMAGSGHFPWAPQQVTTIGKEVRKACLTQGKEHGRESRIQR